MAYRSIACTFGAALFMAFCAPCARAGDDIHVTVHPLYGAGTLTSQGIQGAQQDIQKIPGAANVVPASEYKQTYALSLRDVLEKTPGVFVQPRFGEDVRLSIRGSGLSRGFHLRGISLLQDGVPFNLSDGSGDFQEIDPLFLQHVEVYRGGNALRYGVATLGGAVNMVTPSGRTAPAGSLLRAEAGSYGTFRVHAETAGRAGNADGFAAMTKSLSDGYRQHTDTDNTRFNGNAGYRLSGDAETRFYLSLNDINQEIPGTLSRFDVLHNPTRATPINIANDYARDIRSLRIANKTGIALANGQKLTFGGYANDKELYHPIFQVIDQKSLDLGLFARLQGNDFIVGLNGSMGTNDAKRYVNQGGSRGALTAQSDQDARNAEIYGEYRFGLADRLSLIAGAQAFVSQRDYDDILSPSASDDATFTAFNPKIGLLYEPRDDMQFFANISRSSEPPTFSELVQAPVAGFVPLDNQSAWTMEIGTRGRTPRFGWDISAYRSEIRDELLQFTVGGGIPASTFNAGRTIHQGIEFSGDALIAPDLTLALTYTLNDFFFDGDSVYGGNNLAGAPPHIFHASLRYEDPRGFKIEPYADWVPEGAWVDYANTLKSDAYATLGLNMSADIAPGINVFLDARNLLDRRYISSFSTVTDASAVATDVFYPGDGRAAYAGLSWRF